MAVLQVNFMSGALGRSVPMNVILPVDKIYFPGMPVREDKPYKTLYLLHGVFGNYTDWITGTSIVRWAEERDLAVVMPSGDNMFYVDQEKSNNYYGRFVGEELVRITRKMFPLSHRREDTFIGGLSMGGYGAMRNGFKYHETFGYIVGLSTAFLLDGIEKRTNDAPFFLERRDYVESAFGNLDTVRESDNDPRWMAKQIKAKGGEFPKVYMACGESDSLLGANRSLRDDLTALGVSVSYEEGPGVHDWDFWNCYIKKALDWLPLEGAQGGMNSGNVGV